MLRLELISNTLNEVIYNYSPEGKEEYGIVSVSLSTGEPEIRKLSPNDEYIRYLFRAITRIKKYIVEKDFRRVISWRGIKKSFADLEIT